MKVVFCDLDSTLCDNRHRWDLTPPKELWNDQEAWLPFNRACVDDAVIESTRRMLASLHAAGMCIVMVSSRDERMYKETVLWLSANLSHPVHGLVLRRLGDVSSMEEFKVETIKRYLRATETEGYLLLDDHVETAVAVWERTGVPVVCVNPYPEMA